MVREIEFRAWLKQEKKMVEVKEIIFAPEKQIAYDAEYRNGKSLPFHYLNYKLFNDIELMQYTGLKDKNGVKIFEGDIVKCGKKIAVVKYGYHNCGCCHDVYGFTVLDKNGVTDAFSFGYCEVIGNIYENKELLENA